LEIIERVIQEHRQVGAHLRSLSLGESIPDEQARVALEKEHAEWIPGQTRNLSDLKARLLDALDALDDGLKKHFAFEEEALPPLMGGLLMRALELQHAEIAGEIARMRALTLDIRTEGIDREQQLIEEMRVQRAIAALSHLIEEHADTEEKMLDMLRRALETGRQ
jgi:hypothetical protein